MAASTLSEIPLTVTHATHTPHQIGYVRTEVIRLLRPSNPKIGKSRLRFDCYKDGMSVAEYKSTVRERLGLVEAGKCGGDLKYDTRHNFIRIEGT